MPVHAVTCWVYYPVNLSMPVLTSSSRHCHLGGTRIICRRGGLWLCGCAVPQANHRLNMPGL